MEKHSGSSIAAYLRDHSACEYNSKLWLRSVLHMVKAAEIKATRMLSDGWAVMWGQDGADSNGFQTGSIYGPLRIEIEGEQCDSKEVQLVAT